MGIMLASIFDTSSWELGVNPDPNPNRSCNPSWREHILTDVVR